MQNVRTRVKNYYEILGIASNASPDEIKMAFRRLARRYHPDVNPNDKTAEDKFKEINEAYDILSDDKTRQQYDIQLFGTSQKRRIFRNNVNQVRRDSDFPSFGVNSVVDQFRNRNGNKTPSDSNRYRPKNTEAYRQGTTQRTKTINPRPIPRDIEAKLTLPLEKAYQGGRERIRLEDGRSIEVEMPIGMFEGQKIRLKGQGLNNGNLYLKISISPHPFF